MYRYMMRRCDVDMTPPCLIYESLRSISAFRQLRSYDIDGLL